MMATAVAKAIMVASVVSTQLAVREGLAFHQKGRRSAPIAARAAFTKRGSSPATASRVAGS
jgi:hypothetical protein